MADVKMSTTVTLKEDDVEVIIHDGSVVQVEFMAIHGYAETKVRLYGGWKAEQLCAKITRLLTEAEKYKQGSHVWGSGEVRK